MSLDEAIYGGHLARIVGHAGRQVLAAWNGGDPAEFEEALALLADVLPDPPEDYDPGPFIAAQSWTFARTMPDHPHFYVMLRASTDWREHLKFLRWIRVHGENEKYEGRSYRYRTVDGWRYWAMGPNDTILNRREAPSAASPMLSLWDQ